MSTTYHVVLTGGVGSRLWPLSRKSRPKQYLEIFKNDSLFELAVKRNQKFSDGLIVVGNKDNRNLSIKSLEKLGVDNYHEIVEATPRNTAPAIAFAAFQVKADDILVVTPADHIIKADIFYDKAVTNAIELAKSDNIVTFGVKPTRPETGYGYIESDGQSVLSFREKPNLETAKDFLQKGNFLWNSGMFCFKAGVFLSELKKYEPEVFENSKSAFEQTEEGRLSEELSMQIPSISVDYAVMERSELIKVVDAEFDWSDMGSFEAVYDYFVESGYPVDDNGNMVIGCEKFTAFVGIKNCIFVNTGDATLILSKEASQDVKGVYQKLKESNSILVD
ncbi:mannose-1-phosphate guanylyltransferase [Zunongwangia endophytica]|uniref:Mannose-1-phosphate guanylyltransferase n=1 Tax=Zunongwangia endophytica TaxID=1808945 RepID=A0ABV8HCH6_9FLAO|nr:sugar phosphate nucleotidyltransferase [Zunongwangia endophytica]MDN3596234.1 sugar phosphate nucleotidyltransferase [Zunongwangia endophytica]